MTTWRDYAWAGFAGIAAVLAVAWAILTAWSLIDQGYGSAPSEFFAFVVVISMELAIGAMVAIAAWHRTIWGCTLDHAGVEGPCQRHTVAWSEEERLR